MQHTRFIFSPSLAQPYPLFLESIGHHEDQEQRVRPEGYPYYHWLHTFSGEGEIELGGSRFRLPRGTGVLLLPGVAHTYAAVTEPWCTQYVTFGGNCAQPILSTLDMQESAMYNWEDESPLYHAVNRLLAPLIEERAGYTEYDRSADLFHFLIAIKKYAQRNNRTSVSHHMLQLQPLIDWLEERYANPDTGIREMAAMLQVTPRHLNTLFQHAFGLSPYAYLIMLRLRKAKELLLSDREQPIRLVAGRVGFRDLSHFTASFRKRVGLTPDRFRQIH
ncbi:helix-turn-helix transcriptional regulator [Paenibacillus oryzisoli]|uniref:helix-turn-helix domain-containing protein n=1 Tax=Paenibacillus oryzisoli TaxID=1850517 RepID=UPI003D2E0EE6